VRIVSRTMETSEDSLLHTRERTADQLTRTAAGTFAIAAVLAATFMSLLYVTLRRHSREREGLLAQEHASRVTAEEAVAQQKRVEVERERLLIEAQQARGEAEAASRTKDSFLATISHELRTPLSPILAWTTLLERGTLDAEQTHKALDTIRRCARAQAQLIEDLLDVSRIIAGKMRLEVRPVDLRAVIEAAVEVVRPAADAKNVRLQLVLDTETAPLSGDPDRLQQVVWNLLANAVKFTPKGGRATVVLERVNSHVEIAVSDTGQGISPAFLPHVFDRFQQADASTTRQYAGLGLGLAIVRHLVEAHGGTVHAESPGPGQGSVFTVTLPLVTVPRTAGEVIRRHPSDVPSTAQDFPTLGGLRTLVVDDEPDSTEVVRTLLANCGAEVRVAASASQALDILDRWKPDVLITDIGMPGEDGYALLAKVRAREDGTARLPAIALTAYASVDDRVRLLSAGFAIHVAKPIEPVELLAVVAGVAERA
jgi:signal transduction histidine kinase/CheY-like chemotaxis protein